MISPDALAAALAWAAALIGLAPIVGAFAAGIALGTARMRGAPEAGHGAAWDELSRDPIFLRPATRGLVAALVPLFFVEMGRRVDLRAALSGSAPALLGALLAVALAGKLVSGIAAPKGSRLAVDIGMIPRGEVGLIFAGIGRSMNLVDEGISSALVLVVLATTVIAPPLLRWRLSVGNPP